MHWTRVKTILIIMFLCIDVLLLTAFFIIQGGVGRIDRETIASAVSVLEKNNIHISADIISNKIPALGTVELENLRADADGFARLVLNDKNAVFKGGTYKSGDKVLAPDGAAFYGTNLLGSVTPFTGEHIKSELEKTGARFRVLSQTSDEIKLVQVIDGKPIFEAQLNVNSNNSVYGYLLLSDKSAGYSKKETAQLIPVCSVLVDLISQPSAIGETVSEIECGYTLGEPDGNDTYTLVSVFPAYRITTESGRIFVFDATTGELAYSKMP